MNINDFLSPKDAVVEPKALEKSQLLKELSRRAAESLGLSAGHIADAILQREKLGSTGVGGGVAIPHARFDDLKKPFGILSRLRKAIDFEAIDDRPVDIVFFLLAPAGREGDQLNALACIARKLRIPAVVSDLRAATDSTTVYHAITVDREGR